MPNNHFTKDQTFFIEAPKIGVVVELGSPTVPATLITPPVSDLDVKKMEGLVGKSVTSVFGERLSLIQPASIRNKISTRLQNLFRFPADSTDEANMLCKKLKDEMPSLVIEAMPEPQASPAIASVNNEPATDLVVPTPDFRFLQRYLGSPPGGVNAFAAWTLPGGDGQGISILDVEGGWRLSHENLDRVRLNLKTGNNSSVSGWVEHGTAVVGILAGTPDNTGVTGVCPGARVGMASVFVDDEDNNQPIANRILVASEFLAPGDVMLIALQRPGPLTEFKFDSDQKGYIPVEYWPDVHAAIQAVVEKGVVVVEVAGNGGENLDDERYEGRFDQAKKDSGAIMVGAAAPFGDQYGPARSRLAFSNYGLRLDCQAWGHAVVTSGYGDLWGGTNQPDRNYTSTFMGTSSAAPIIAGVVACLQGRHRIVYGTPLVPQVVRAALNQIGWPQVHLDKSAPLEHIGTHPDLLGLFRAFGLAM